MSNKKGVEDLKSDGELSGEDESQSKKFMQKELTSVGKWDAKGVSVDERTLEGRRGNRGFTVSMSKSSDPTAEFSDLRREKRAQTLPATVQRRGDYELSEEAVKALEEQQKTLQARFRRGSVSVSYTIVPDEELVNCWKASMSCFVTGKMTEGQAAADERDRIWRVATKCPGDLPPVISCTKGSKGARDTTPNQDNFSISYFKNGYTMVCVMDGHGPFGHLVSSRTVQTIPYYVANHPKLGVDMAAVLIEAFEASQKDVVALSLADNWDIQASGSTAVAAIWKGNKIWTANVGDSRCVIGYESTKKLVFETEDHKPNSPAEQARIEAAGGEVRSQTYSDGWTVHRIFVKGQDFPGLCMARTMGDESVKAHGVVAIPEVKMTEVDLAAQPFLILASDGVWEFLESDFVMKALAKKIQSDGPEKTVQKLQREARKRWKQEEGDYCDDITAVLIQLR